MKYGKIGIRVLGILAILAIFAGMAGAFSLQLQRALTRETYRMLSAVSMDYNKSFLDRISYHIKTMKILADGLEAMQDHSKDGVLHILSNAVKDGEWTAIVVCDANGTGCSDKGVTGNVSQRDYFQKAMRGETTISQPQILISGGKESIVIAVPIRRGETIPGVLFGVYPLNIAGLQLLDFTYYKEGYGFIIAPDGTILLSGEHQDKLADEKNIFSFFEKTDFLDYSMKELREAIRKGESKSFSFRYNGQRRFVSFMPSTVNDWVTFSIVSDAPMLRQEKVANRIVAQLILGLMSAGILLMVWILLRNRHYNKNIRMASQRYQSLLAHINGGMVLTVHAKTADETIVTYVSTGFTEMTGYTLEDLQTQYGGRYPEVIPAEDREAVWEKWSEQLETGTTYRLPYRIRTKEGTFIWALDNGYLIRDADGLHNQSILTDITLLKQQEEALRMSENRFSIAINASSGTLFEVDLEKQLYTHFENAERIFGVNAEKLLEDTRAFSTLPYNAFTDAVITYFFHPDDYLVSKNAMGELLQKRQASYEARLHRFDRDGYIWARIDLSLQQDECGKPTYLIGFMSDIDAIKKQAEALESKVQTDPMTGLYNKIAMATLANKILNECPNGHHALILLDIDNFKGINDTLGHAFGDLVLIEIATKLKAAFRNNDVVGRMGGDEFSVLMKNVSDTSSVLKKATELSAAFRQTYSGEKEDYTISCSIGIIMIETNGEGFETLYRKADAALYRAKQNGKDQFVLYQEKDTENYPIAYARTDDEELQKLKASHNMEAQIFELMYTAKDFNLNIHMALAAIGQHYHVSRVSIFENDENGRTTSNIYEWCNEGILPAMGQMQSLSLMSGSESIMDCFDADGLLYCSNIRELPPYFRQILTSRSVLSTLKVTITNDEHTCGYIGFDECKEYRVWTSEEIEKLSFLAKVLSVFLFKKRAEVALLENLHTRLKILDILPDGICVINPTTHALEYTNRKMKEMLPSAQLGAFCFTTLRGGQIGPCETCLLERIKRGDVNDLEIVSEDHTIRLRVNAISIRWTKNQQMVLLYGSQKTEEIL